MLLIIFIFLFSSIAFAADSIQEESQATKSEHFGLLKEAPPPSYDSLEAGGAFRTIARQRPPRHSQAAAPRTTYSDRVCCLLMICGCCFAFLTTAGVVTGLTLTFTLPPT